MGKASPLVHLLAASAGFDAARLDYNPTDQCVYLSILRGGRVLTKPIPCGVTYTREQVVDLLLSDYTAETDEPRAVKAG